MGRNLNYTLRMIGLPVAFGSIIALALVLIWLSLGKSPDKTTIAVSQVAPGSIISEDHTPLLLIVLLCMAITTAVSIGISFYLYRWRRILIGDHRITVPEELGRWVLVATKRLKFVQLSLDSFSETQERHLRQFSDAQAETDHKVADLLATTLTLQHALDDRDNEIRRLRLGHDTEVFRRFLSRFIRVRQTIHEFETDASPKTDALHQLTRLFDDALDECGVEEFQPTIGVDYRTTKGVADNPRTIKAASADDDFRIAEILRPGYRLRGDNGEIIIPARVAIYVV